MHISEVYDVLSIHDTLEEAKTARQWMIKRGELGGGFALSILHEDDGDPYELVVYRLS